MQNNAGWGRSEFHNGVIIGSISTRQGFLVIGNLKIMNRMAALKFYWLFDVNKKQTGLSLVSAYYTKHFCRDLFENENTNKTDNYRYNSLKLFCFVSFGRACFINIYILMFYVKLYRAQNWCIHSLRVCNTSQ